MTDEVRKLITQRNSAQYELSLYVEGGYVYASVRLPNGSRLLIDSARPVLLRFDKDEPKDFTGFLKTCRMMDLKPCHFGTIYNQSFDVNLGMVKPSISISIRRLVNTSRFLVRFYSVGDDEFEETSFDLSNMNELLSVNFGIDTK